MAGVQEFCGPGGWAVSQLRVVSHSPLASSVAFYNGLAASAPGARSRRRWEGRGRACSCGWIPPRLPGNQLHSCAGLR